MRLSIAAALVSILLAGAISGKLADSHGRLPPDDELRLFPSGKFLEIASLGFVHATADLAWLAAVQYFGKHHMTDRDYPMARHLFEVTTRLDPQFKTAYIFGGLVLSDDVGDLDAARRLMSAGAGANPSDWRIEFHRGFMETTRGDRRLGAAQMHRASRMQGAAPYTKRLAAHALSRTGQRDLAIHLWEELGRDPDPAIRAIAEQRLLDLRGNAAGESRR